MINMRGELVGINTAILSRSGGYQGIGFAIPSNMASPIMKSLLKNGRVVRGWLGVVIQGVDQDLAKAFKLPTKKGVLISDVDPSGPAYKAGIKRGDVVVRINGKTVHTTGKLRNIVASAGAKAKVRLEFYRKGRLMVKDITLAVLPQNLNKSHLGTHYPPSNKGSVGVAPLDSTTRAKFHIPAQLKYGVVVVSIDPKSAAAKAGLSIGDVILEVNRARISTVRSFSQSFHRKKGQILLLIYRRGNTVFMTFRK
jgi:serine protease Do